MNNLQWKIQEHEKAFRKAVDEVNAELKASIYSIHLPPLLAELHCLHGKFLALTWAAQSLKEAAS